MRKPSIVVLCVVCLCLPACYSPRDFLTRRLAADLIAASNTFQTQQQFQLRTGVVSNKDYLSTEYLALQHQGWIFATVAACPAALGQPPCWDVTLTPSGVTAVQSLIAPGDKEKRSFNIPTARREVVAITGIIKQGSLADVEFVWHWIPMNEVGAALYAGDLRYQSNVSFRRYDDGWRVVQAAAQPAQPLDEALKNAQPAP